MRSNLLTIASAIALLLCVQTPAFAQGVPIGVRGSVPICAHAQLHAGTCQLSQPGYTATITNASAAEANPCAPGAATGSDQITCRYKTGTGWEEFEPVVGSGGDLGAAATGSALTITNTGGTNASIPAATSTTWGALTDEDKTKLDGIAVGAIANVFDDTTPQFGGPLDIPDDQFFDLDSDGVGGLSELIVRDGALNQIFNFNENGKLTIGNPTAGGSTGAAGTLDETALLVTGNLEVDGGTAALGTAEGAHDGQILLWANNTDLDIIAISPNPAADTDAWTWFLPLNGGTSGEVMKRGASNTSDWAFVDFSELTSVPADLTNLVNNCVLENDSTPIPDSCVGDGSDGGGGGGISGAALTECFTLWAPSAGILETDDVQSFWRAPANATITSVWCEAQGGGGVLVVSDVQIDDGTPADVTASALGCDADGNLAAASAGSIAAGNTLDLAITTVLNSPTRLSVCVNYDYD